MSVSTLKIGGREYVLVPRRQFEQMCRRADLMDSQDAVDAAESIRRLKDPAERRIPWSQVKKRAGLP